MNSRELLNSIDAIVNSPSRTDLIEQLASYSRTASFTSCREIIDQVKRILKKSRWDAIGKLQALRLFDQCFQQRNSEFLEYASRKILRRLTVLASHRRADRDPDRGRDIFKATNHEQVAASVQFLTTLLTGFETWATISIAFQTAKKSLEAQGVTFPRQARKQQLESSTPLRLAASLQSVIGLKNPDPTWVEELAGAVREAAGTLSVNIQVSIHSPRLPEMIEELDQLQTALEAYEKFKESRLLIKTDEKPAGKVRSDSELVMLASFASKAIPEPLPLPLPDADPELESLPLVPLSETLTGDIRQTHITPREIDEVVSTTQLEELNQAQWMQRVEELRCENEALKREVAALKKAQTLSPQKPSSELSQSLPASRNSLEEETTRVLRRSPMENAFATISPNRYVDLLGFESPMRPTVNLGRSGSFDEPTTPTKGHSPAVVNEPWFLESAMWSTGLAYKCEDMEVLTKLEVDRQRGTVKLCFRNTSPDALLNLCLVVLSQEVTVREPMQEPPPSILPPASQYVFVVEARPQRAYASPPVVSVSYSKASAKVAVEFGLRLPLPLSKFVSPVGSEYSEIRSLATESREPAKSARFAGLKSGITNMKTLAKIFCLNNAFSLYFPNETGIERAIVGCGVAFGTPVLAEVQLNETATQVDLRVSSKDPVLREQLHRLLAFHIAKQGD